MTVETLLLGGVNCTTLNDDCFSKVREFFSIGVDFAENSFDFSQLRAGGGKGGDPMKMTNDGLFFVKFVNPGDHKVLSDAVFVTGYTDHITNVEKPSLLCPILCHVFNPSTKKHYIVLMNVLRHRGKYFKQYDLKGCADDKLLHHDGSPVVPVHKRVWHVHIHCGCGNEQRRIYKAGKLEALHEPHLPISLEDKTLVLEALQYDTEFLRQHNLMDYSLIVGVVSKQTDNFTSEGLVDSFMKQRLCAGKPLETKEYVIYLGVIDFLQKWTGGKAVAQVIKSLEHNKATVRPKKYAKRFVEHFDHAFITVDEEEDIVKEQIRRRNMRKKPHRCFPLGRK